jgi:hypothetical protein
MIHYCPPDAHNKRASPAYQAIEAWLASCRLQGCCMCRMREATATAQACATIAAIESAAAQKAQDFRVCSCSEGREAMWHG